MTDTESVLRSVLEVVRRDGWKPNGWGLVGPYCLRRALGLVVSQTLRPGERDDANTAARQAISQAIGQPLGLLSYWESQPGRAQADVEDVLEKAIAGLP